MKNKIRKPEKLKILVLDIETKPMTVLSWGIHEQDIQLPQIVEDWSVLAVCAKWYGEKKVFYYDQRNAKDINDDKKLLEKIWDLMDEADIILGQNSIDFDTKKLNARFIINGMKPPAGYRQIDTAKIARKYFGMTSNKLEYLSKKLCTNKKSSHKKFPGLSLWKECMKGNKAAWKEMEKYNKMDVISTEELYSKLQPWDVSSNINFNVYHDHDIRMCKCGSTNFRQKGFAYTASGKYQRYECLECGLQHQDKKNLLDRAKMKSLGKGISR